MQLGEFRIDGDRVTHGFRLVRREFSQHQHAVMRNSNSSGVREEGSKFMG